MLDLGGGTLCWQAGPGRLHPVSLDGQESTDPLEATRPGCPKLSLHYSWSWTATATMTLSRDRVKT